MTQLQLQGFQRLPSRKGHRMKIRQRKNKKNKRKVKRSRINSEVEQIQYGDCKNFLVALFINTQQQEAKIQQILKLLRSKSINKLMNSQSHNLAASNQSYQIVKEAGGFNVMGNGNKIHFKQCHGQLNLMGNGNQVFLLKSRVELTLNGNANIIRMEEGELRVGINGNSNQVIEHQNPTSQNNSFWKQPSSNITVLFNNGNSNVIPNRPNNQFSKNSVKGQVNKPRTVDNSSQGTQAMRGVMGFEDNAWGQMNMIGNAQSNSFHQHYNPSLYQMQMHAPFWGMQMQMMNPFQVIAQSSTHNNSGYFNPYNNVQHQRGSGWNEPDNRINSTTDMSDGYYNSYNNDSDARRRSRQYRFQEQAPNDRGRTRFGIYNRNRSPRNVNPRQQQQIMIRGTNEEDQEEDQNLPHFGQRPLYQFQPTTFAARYAFNLDESVPGLTEEQTSFLPRSEYKGKTGKCSICLEEMSEGHQVTYLFCFHAFHSQCGISWLKKSATCPLCQLDLRPHLKTNQ